jgi:charged multivesicular body protein 7
MGIQAMKEKNVSIEEVNIHLKEFDELVAAQREIDAALGKLSFENLLLVFPELLILKFCLTNLR